MNVLPSPLRTSLTQQGAVKLPLFELPLPPPVELRYWNAAPLPGVITIIACSAPAVRSLRIITPAFAQPPVFAWLTTRATIVPLPVSD